MCLNTWITVGGPVWNAYGTFRAWSHAGGSMSLDQVYFYSLPLPIYRPWFVSAVQNVSSYSPVPDLMPTCYHVSHPLNPDP